MKRALLASCAVALLGAAGCDSYHYYDMSLVLGSTFTTALVGEAQLCKVNISGADSHEFNLTNCGVNSNDSNIPDVGTFEFATFADSGTLTFTVDAYNGITPTPNCLYGSGMTSQPASSQITQMGTITLQVTGTGCPNSGQ
jgi:hypothetical protein